VKAASARRAPKATVSAIAANAAKLAELGFFFGEVVFAFPRMPLELQKIQDNCRC
jgi:hypothetical protein